MDPQHHHHPLADDQSQALAGPYAYYTTDQDPAYALAYNQQVQPYQVVHHPGPPPRHLSAPDLQQGIPFHNLSLMSAHHFSQQAPVYSSSPQHVPMLMSGSPPPPSPHMYDPLSPPISGSDTSADGIYHHSRNSSGTGSPSSSRGASLVHRTSLRYNPTPSPSSSSGRRGRGRSLHDSDDEDMGAYMVENLAHTRKEATRRQRIEAEQRRRDELRDGYAKLKDVLPVSNQKSSKVSLLERATNHIIAMEKSMQEVQARLHALEQEVQRLRAVNDKITMTQDTPSPGQSGQFHAMDSRPISPPPDEAFPMHSLATVRGQEPPREESGSPSVSEVGY